MEEEKMKELLKTLSKETIIELYLQKYYELKVLTIEFLREKERKNEKE